MISSTDKFLDSNYTAAINATAVDGTNFTSRQISLEHAEEASITVYAKGNHASCSKDITFTFRFYNKALGAWDSAADITLTATLSGTSAVYKTTAITPSASKIKLYSINNPETTSGYTAACNAAVFYKDK
jgi:hypothetical protein